MSKGLPHSLESLYERLERLEAHDGAKPYVLPDASASAIGGVKMAAVQSNAGASSATDVATLQADFNNLASKYNALLDGLRASGVLASS